MQVNSINNGNFRGGIKSRDFLNAINNIRNSRPTGKIAKLFKQAQAKMEELGIDVFVTPHRTKMQNDPIAWSKSLLTKISFKYDKSASTPKELQGQFADRMFRIDFTGAVDEYAYYGHDSSIVNSSEKDPNICAILDLIMNNVPFLDKNKKAGVIYRRIPMPVQHPNDHTKPRLFKLNAYMHSEDFTPNKIPFITAHTDLHPDCGRDVVLHWLPTNSDPGIRIKSSAGKTTITLAPGIQMKEALDKITKSILTE